MPIATCPQCGMEFSAAEPLDPAGPIRADGTQACPACGHRFVPAAAAVRVAGPKPMTGGAILGVRMAILAGVAVDVAAGLLAIRCWPGPGEGSAFGSVLLLAALSGHALMSFSAVAVVPSRLPAAVAAMRVALASWLLLGGGALALGARLWPAGGTRDPLVLLAVASAGFVLLLAYLRTLESLAQRAEPSEEDLVAPPRPAARAGAIAVLLVNLALLAACVALAVWARRQERLTTAVPAWGAVAALALHELFGWAGLRGRQVARVAAARALGRSFAALVVAALLVVLAQTGRSLAPGVPTGVVAAILAVDLLAAALVCWRLTPVRRAGGA